MNTTSTPQLIETPANVPGGAQCQHVAPVHAYDLVLNCSFTFVAFRALLVCWLISFTAQTNAQLLLTESFNYPNGPLVGAVGSPWVVNYPGTNSTAVAAGRLFLTQSEDESVRFNLPTNVTTGTMFVAMRVEFTELPKGNGNYFAFFRQQNVDNLRGRLWTTTNTAAAGKFRLGCLTINGSPTLIPEDLSLNTSYTLLLRYNITNYTTTLWIDPATENDATRRADNVFSEGDLSRSVGHFGFKQVANYENSANGMGSLHVDEVRIGRSFAAALGIPRLSTLVRNANGQVSLTGVGIPTTSYQLQATTNATAGNWIPLSTNAAAEDGALQFTDLAAPNSPIRFYRLLEQ